MVDRKGFWILGTNYTRDLIQYFGSENSYH